MLNISSGTKASAAFMIIGTFVLLAGAIEVTIGMVKSQKSLMKTGGIITIVGSLNSFIGVAVFAGVSSISPPVIYSASFVLAWLAVVFGIAGGALAIKSTKE